MGRSCEASRIGLGRSCWALSYLTLPYLTLGQPHLNTSQNTIVGMMDGSLSQLDNSCKSIVDVRDVAEAHVAAVEARDPNPRHAVCQRRDSET